MIDDPVSPTRPTLGVLLRRLIGQIQTLIRAEIGLYRAEATWRAISIGRAAGFAFGALALAQALLAALLVGLIMALAPVWGIAWAIGSVMLGGFVITGLLGWLAYRRIRAVFRPAPSPAKTLQSSTR